MFGLVSAQGFGTVLIRPNPVTDAAELVFSESPSEPYSVVIKDLTGKTIQHISIQENQIGLQHIRLDLSAIPEGVYLCQIAGTSGRTRTLRFQKL